MSAASRATSVPLRPIATPMSAVRSAGASLTPSPVIATTSPASCSARAIRSFCSGVTRGDERVGLVERGDAARRRPCASSRGAVEDRARALEQSPMRRAIASAVMPWSPVTMTTRIPAARQRPTASATSGRGGSCIPTRPSNSSRPRTPRPRRCGQATVGAPRHREHAQRRRAPARRRPPAHAPARRRRALCARMTDAGAPLTYAVSPPGASCTVVMRLRSESNGTSPRRG